MGAVHGEVEVCDALPGVFGGEAGSALAPFVGQGGSAEIAVELGGEAPPICGDEDLVGLWEAEEIVALEVVLVDGEDKALPGKGLPDGEIAGDEGEVRAREERGRLWDRAEELDLEALGLGEALCNGAERAVADDGEGKAAAVILSQGDEGIQVEHNGGILGEATHEESGGLRGQRRRVGHGVYAAAGDREAGGAVPAADEVAHADCVSDTPADEAAPADGFVRDGVALIAVEGKEDRAARGQPAGGEVEVEEAVCVVAMYHVRGGDVRAGGAPGRGPTGAGDAVKGEGAELFLGRRVGVGEHRDLVSLGAQAL